jgi:hypothetical protein
MRAVTGSQPDPWAVIRGLDLRALPLFLLAFAATAMAQSVATPKHFNDADLEAIFTYVLVMPAIKDRAPEPLPRG